MVVSKSIVQSKSGLTWNRNLPLEKKLIFLKSYFNGSLDQVPFWKLYKVVKKLNS